MWNMILVAGVCVGLAACNTSGPTQPVSSSIGDSGITASNGGGQRALGNTPSVSVGTGGATLQSVPNSRGSSY